MFNQIKSYIFAAAAGLLLFLGIALKFVLRKNKKLKHEIKVKDKTVKIGKEQNKVINKVRDNEHKKIEELIEEESSPSGRSSKLNSLLHD